MALELKPSLVITGYRFPNTTGDILVKEIKYRLPETKILPYTFYFDERTVLKMFFAGANGFMLKDYDECAFIKAIHYIMEGHDYFCKEARIHLINRVSFDDTNPTITVANIGFNRKELEVLKLLCMQRTSREISKDVFLSEKTVEQYRSRILKKTNSRNIVGVIKFALQHGIIHLDDL